MKKNRHAKFLTIFWSCAFLLAVQLTARAQTLVNEYSFNDASGSTNCADSVGGTNWYGVLPSGGTFIQPGVVLSASQSQYVQLPAGILSNYTAVTIDVWATFGTLPANCFLYGFGNTDGSGAGDDYIFCQPENGRIAITGGDPGWQFEQGCGGAGNFSGQTVHVTSVYNPPAGYIELYTNGALVSFNNGITVPMSAVADVLNYIGRSLYTGDGYGDVILLEFRIWNGALNSLQVAGSDLSGSTVVGTNAGTVTNIQLNTPYYQIAQGGKESASVVAQATLFSGPIDVTRLATYSSSKTNIFSVDTNGVISAVGQGSATITATYGSLTSSQILTAVAPVVILTHRYSFANNNALDSVGGPAFTGTLVGAASISNGLLNIPNTAQTAPAPDYLLLPDGVLTNAVNGVGTNQNDPAVTIEAWASFAPSQGYWAALFDFGYQDGSGYAAYDIHLGQLGGSDVIGISDTDNANGFNDSISTGIVRGDTNVQIVCVFNPPGGYEAVYTNGVLAGVDNSVTISMAGVWGVMNKIGADLWPDPGMQGSVSEFRIFNGAVTSQGAAISYQAGQNTVASGELNGPGALESFTLQAPATLQWLQTGSLKLLANYASLTNWDILGNSIVPPAGLTVTSSDPKVLAISGGTLTGVNPGTATITLVYQGTTQSVAVTVVRAPVSSLAHRYSFTNNNAFDSVGGPAFTGTLQGAATISGGLLNIPNTSQAAPAPDYLLLPDGILTNAVNGVGTNQNDPSVTIEAWASFASSQGYWAALFDFGYQDGSGYAAYDIHLGQLGGSDVIGISDTDNANGFNDSISTGIVRGDTNVQIVCVFNPPGGYEAVYTNGVLAGVDNSVTISMAGVWGVMNKIGADLWPDPGMQGSVSEFRIYNGALMPDEVAASQILGPNVLLTNAPTLNASPSAGKVVISWPLAGAGFTLYSSSSLGPNAVWTPVIPAPAVAGQNYQATISPNGGATQFYVLKR